MIIFKALLFILSCFTFSMACSYTLQSFVDAVAQASYLRQKTSIIGYPSLIASLAFTYIMVYLFIW